MRNLINVSALTDHLIRPPKFTYSLNDLGSCIFDHNNRIYERIDFSVLGKENNRIQASIWKLKETGKNGAQLRTGRQVLVYLHCNCGSRVEAMQFVYNSLQLGYTFVAYDSQACGHSQGQYISLGYHEDWDLQAVINHINLHYVANPQIVLWGRSMGAVTSIKFLTSRRKYASNVKVAVLDSPFVNLKEVICQIVNRKLGAPKILIDILVRYLEPVVQEKAGFKISQFDLRDEISKIQCPLILMASKSDGLVPFQHLQQIYDAHQGRKSIFYLKESHTDQRSTDTIQKIFKAINRYYVACVAEKDQEHQAHSLINKNQGEAQLQSCRSSEFKDPSFSTNKSSHRKKIEITYRHSTEKLQHNYTDFSTEKTRPCIQPASESKKKKLSLNHSKSIARVASKPNTHAAIHLYSNENKNERKSGKEAILNSLHRLTPQEMSHKKIVSNFEDILNKQNYCGRQAAMEGSKKCNPRIKSD